MNESYYMHNVHYVIIILFQFDIMNMNNFVYLNQL